MLTRGTSPRMRGKPLVSPLRAAYQRNIPAYAGKTNTGSESEESNEEHPRVCGENGYMIGEAYIRIGTSPRMRGKLTPIIGDENTSGNIPAYAGKTGRCCPQLGCRTEHPRVCGENASHPGNFDNMAGTSPRMRGKLISPTVCPEERRNIPAYAGKT